MNSAVEGETSEDRRILVVDDTVICRTLLTRFLEKLDYVADSVASGAEAVTAYQERRYAAILMDVQMPIMSGFEATIRIRQQEKASGAHVPVIAITAHTQPGDRDHCLAGGMDEYLPKPITLEALKRVLARSLPQFSIPATMNAPGVAPSSLLVEKG
jgi:CheY-like chemotaxis protein